MFAHMRAELDALDARHRQRHEALRLELDALRREVDQLRELRATVVARQAAERDLAALRQRRDAIVEAFGAEHDGTPLH